MTETDPVRPSIALRSVPGVGDAIFRSLLERFGSAARALGATLEELREAGASATLARAVSSFGDWKAVDETVARARLSGAEIVVPGDDRYPPGLRVLFDPPAVLYVRGRLLREDALAIAVVGSRDASPQGLATAETIAADLAGAGVTVVSGLALGIDAAAHRGALEGGGRTIAVLGSGIDRIYPRPNRRLAEAIAANGAIVSEHPPGTPPEPGHFPRRNRIVSGLALGVVVVEATERSGSLITARLAAEQGREVLAVPGPAGAPRSRGTHRLLRDGAGLVERGADVIEHAIPWLLEMATKTSQTDRSRKRSGGDLDTMLECIGESTTHVNELIRRSGLTASRALEVLLALELRGHVRRHPGPSFSRRMAGARPLP